MWATRLFNNPYLALANRFAPIVSATILSVYAFCGKKVEIIKPIGDNEKPVLHFVGIKEHAKRFWSIGGG